MVVAISAISYASYVLQKVTKGQGGIVLAALLGGAYSSTVTTVVLARRVSVENQPHLFSGGILMASGVMYLRLAILLALFNRQLMAVLWCRFWCWRWWRSASAGCGRGRADRVRRRAATGSRSEESAGADYGVHVCLAVSW